jgi:hypothetical protein
MEGKYSLAARLLIVSGKLSGLTEGFTFYETPTGEKINSRTLAAYLIAATIEDLKKRGIIDYKEGEIKAVIGGNIPVLILNRKKGEGVGFEKIVLEKLEKEKNLIDLIKDIIGGAYQIPEQRILWLIRKEFPTDEYMRQEKVTMMFIFSRMETKWIPEKVTPLAEKWLPELRPVWEKLLSLPWLKTAVRNVNFGLSATKAQEKDDND